MKQGFIFLQASSTLQATWIHVSSCSITAIRRSILVDLQRILSIRQTLSHLSLYNLKLLKLKPTVILHNLSYVFYSLL